MRCAASVTEGFYLTVGVVNANVDLVDEAVVCCASTKRNVV